MREAQHQQVFFVEQHLKRLKTKCTTITFADEDARGVVQPHNDALVITIMIASFAIWRVLLYNGSSADIIFSRAYDQLEITEAPLVLANSDLFGFEG